MFPSGASSAVPRSTQGPGSELAQEGASRSRSWASARAELIAEAEHRLESDNGASRRAMTSSARRSSACAPSSPSRRGAFASATAELEAHAAERRRALHELAERLRRRSRSSTSRSSARRTRPSPDPGELRGRRAAPARPPHAIDRPGRPTLRGGRRAAVRGLREGRARRGGPTPVARARRSSAMFAREAESVLAERLSKSATSAAAAREAPQRERSPPQPAQRRIPGHTGAAPLRRGARAAAAHRALEAETEAERGILETRLPELARRIDETVAQAENRLSSVIRSS